jgi:hypothetical protein
MSKKSNLYLGKTFFSILERTDFTGIIDLHYFNIELAFEEIKNFGNITIEF